MSLLRCVPTHNYCTFQDRIYLQIEGTAKGTPVATTYAYIFLYGTEHQVIPTHTPTYYKRYIDDIYAIYRSDSVARNFIDAFNNMVPSITLKAVTISSRT
jgi:hypothetical protein